MQELPQPTRSLLSILVVAVSAIAFLVSTGVGVVWPLAWLAPIPVLVLAVHRSWRAAALVAFTASLLGDLTLARIYGPGAVLIFGIPPAMAFAAATLAARAATRRMAAWLAVFAFPTVVASWLKNQRSRSARGSDYCRRPWGDVLHAQRRLVRLGERPDGCRTGRRNDLAQSAGFEEPPLTPGSFAGVRRNEGRRFLVVQAADSQIPSLNPEL